MLDGNMDVNEDDLDNAESEGEVDQAAERLSQICKYSHKIIKKYVVNGMITLQDGPQLHKLVDQRDYRIICILEVYSQNKNEDDFLENVGLLTQVIKEQKEQEKEDGEDGDEDGDVEQVYSNDDERREGMSDVGINEGPASPQEEEMKDSFEMTIDQAINLNYLERDAGEWSIGQQKEGNRRVKMTYNVYKQGEDLKDFGNSLDRLFKKAFK